MALSLCQRKKETKGGFTQSTRRFLMFCTNGTNANNDFISSRLEVCGCVLNLSSCYPLFCFAYQHFPVSQQWEGNAEF